MNDKEYEVVLHFLGSRVEYIPAESKAALCERYPYMADQSKVTVRRSFAEEIPHNITTHNFHTAVITAVQNVEADCQSFVDWTDVELFEARGELNGMWNLLVGLGYPRAGSELYPWIDGILAKVSREIERRQDAQQ